MKTELYKDIFEARNPEDEQEVKIRNMWKEDVPIFVFYDGKMEKGWKIKGVFAKEENEPLRVRISSPEATHMVMVNADDFLKWQEENQLEN
jgi:hypothetical protein